MDRAIEKYLNNSPFHHLVLSMMDLVNKNLLSCDDLVSAASLANFYIWQRLYRTAEQGEAETQPITGYKFADKYIAIQHWKIHRSSQDEFGFDHGFKEGFEAARRIA